MHPMESILEHYNFTTHDEALVEELAQAIIPIQDRFADDFYLFLQKDGYTAAYFSGDLVL